MSIDQIVGLALMSGALLWVAYRCLAAVYIHVGLTELFAVVLSLIAGRLLLGQSFVSLVL